MASFLAVFLALLPLLSSTVPTIPTSLSELLDGHGRSWTIRSDDAAAGVTKVARLNSLRQKINDVFLGPATAKYDKHGFDAAISTKAAEALAAFVVEESKVTLRTQHPLPQQKPTRAAP